CFHSRAQQQIANPFHEDTRSEVGTAADRSDNSFAALPKPVRRISTGRHGTGAAAERQLLLEARCASSIDQNACMTAKMYAALTPTSSIPLTASRAPIIRQCCSSASPDAPRVLIESTE